MPKQELGRVRQVPLSEVFDNEPQDFTPWLYENLDLLGDALNLDLTPSEREGAVGTLSVDIVAESEFGTVVIENQLGKTDHGHLGQLLSYAAGREAEILVWVAPMFKDEHRAAIDWLNRWTPEDIETYGVEVRAIRIGESPPAPEFRAVAYPNNWSRRVRSQNSDTKMSDDEWDRRVEFFSTLATRAHERDLTESTGFSVVAKSKSFPCRVDEPGLKYWVDLRPTGVTTVHLDVRTGDVMRNDAIISGLELHKTSIEEELGFWPDLDAPDPDGPHGRIAGRVTRFRNASINDPPDQVEETLEWCLESLAGFQRVLDPRLRAVIDELDSVEE